MTIRTLQVLRAVTIYVMVVAVGYLFLTVYAFLLEKATSEMDVIPGALYWGAFAPAFIAVAVVARRFR